MFAKRPPNALSSFQIKRSDIQFLASLPAFTLDNIVQAARMQQINLTADDRQALSEALNKNTACLEFVKYIQQIIEIENSKESGVGLTDREKSHYNELKQAIADNRPSQADQLSEMRSKVRAIREVNLPIAKYSNILKLYNAYLGVLNSNVMVVERLDDLAKEWEVQKYYAASDAHELLALNRVYINAEKTIENFCALCMSDRVELSIQAKQAILAFCGNFTAQTRLRQIQVLESMLFRVEQVEKRCDIHYDDVIYYFIHAIEMKLGHRAIKEDESKKAVFDQLRRRRRRGMTYDALREINRQLRAYIESPDREPEDGYKKAEIGQRLKRLRLSEVPEELVKIVKPESSTDPVMLFLHHQFDSCIAKIKESLLLEAEDAIGRVDDLYQLLEEAKQIISSNRLTVWWPFTQTVGTQIDSYHARFDDLLRHVYDFLSTQLKHDANEIIKKAASGRVVGMEEWLLHRNILLEFYRNYHLRLGKKPIEMTTDFLVHVVAYLLVNDMTLDSDKFCEALAVCVVQFVYWPLENERVAEYDATKRAFIRALKMLENKRIRGSILLNKYINYNWVIYFLESVLPPREIMLAQREQLAKSFDHEWKVVFPLEEVLCKDGFFYSIPSHIRSDLSITASNNPKSQRRTFLLSIESIVKQIHVGSMYMVNVVIPHVKFAPFITLLTLNRGDRFVSNLDELIGLHSQLCEVIREKLRDKSISKETVHLLEKMLDYSNKQLEAINHDWQDAILVNIHANFVPEDLCAYLEHPDTMIDLSRLRQLYAKVDDFFTYPSYKSVLFDKINKACVKLLISNGMRALAQSIDSVEFHKFISVITELSFFEEQGAAILKQFILNEDIQARIMEHINQFDGSREEIGSLISVICPANSAAGTNDISRYVMPYAKKRLDYLRQNNGNGIRLNDVMFFDSYNSIPEVRALFEQHREYYDREVIAPIRKNAATGWSPTVARIVELFGSKFDRQVYRALCLTGLLKKENISEADMRSFTSFRATLYHHDSTLIEPSLQLPGEACSFEEFLDRYIDVLPWNELRDRIIMLFGIEKSQYYHERCVYQFLNNNMPGYGDWLNILLGEMHPYEFFGKDKVNKIVEHVLSLIKVAEDATRDFDITEKQAESMKSLLQNISFMKIIFERIGDLTGYQIVSEISSLEGTLQLALLTKRLLELICRGHGEVAYSDEAIGKLVYQLYALFNEVDGGKLVTLANIRQYLIFLDQVITNVRTANLDRARDDYLQSLYSFYSHFLQHFKQMLFAISRLDILPVTDQQYLVLTANCLDSNGKIEARRQEVLDGFDQAIGLKDIADAVMQLAVRVNNKLGVLNKAIEDRINAEAGVKLSLENPQIFARICLKRTSGLDWTFDFVNPYRQCVVNLTRRAIQNVNMAQFCELTQSCVTLLGKLESTNRSIPVDMSSHLRLSMFGSSQVVQPASQGQLLDELHVKYIAAFCYHKLVDYVYSRVDIKDKLDRFTLFESLTTQLASFSGDRVQFIKTNFRVNELFNARKIELAVEVGKWLLQLFNGTMKKTEFEAKIDKLVAEIASKDQETHNKFYRSKEFSDLLRLMLEIVKSNSITELLQSTSSARMTYKH